MTRSTSLLACSICVIAAVGVLGVSFPDRVVSVASVIVDQFFVSRGWFVMLAVSAMLLLCIGLAVSPYGSIRLGADDDRPEFSTPSWIAMLFAAGMGVGLLFWAVAEPLTHYAFGSQFLDPPVAFHQSLLATNFHWGLHAWGIYGATALSIAYFAFRRGAPMLVSGPIVTLFPGEAWARIVGWLADFMAIVAIAIGVGGSIAMGVFQVADGVDVVLGGDGAGAWLIGGVFVAMVLAYLPPLMMDLGAGMSKLSNLAMLVAIGLLLYVLIIGPTEFLMNTVVAGFGEYIFAAIPRGFQTLGFFDDGVKTWFKDWTLTYMVWWVAWGPFVGVFIARISKGRTIREFVCGVLIAPTVFSIFWFGIFGGIGFYDVLNGTGELLVVTTTNVERVTFSLLERLPLSMLTTVATIIAAFLFIVTSVVSAAFVLGAFSSGGDANPAVKIRLIWGGLLGLLGAAMVISGSIDAVKKMIAIGALPFIFVSVLLCVCLLRGLREEMHE